MPTDVQISQWLQPGFFTNKELQGQVTDLAQQYPYFLPLKVVAGLQHDREQTFRELPYYYGVNRVLLADLEQRLHTQPKPENAEKEVPAAGETIAEAVVAEKDVSEEKNGLEEASEEEISTGENTEIPAAETSISTEEKAVEVISETEIAEERAAENPASETEVATEENTETEVPAAESAALPAPEITDPVDERVEEAGAEKEILPEANTIPAAPEAEVKTPEAEAMPVPEVPVPAPQPVAPTPATSDATAAKPVQQPEIQPLYTKDYFSHQGLSNPAEELNIFNAHRPAGNDLMVMRSFGEWLRFFQSKKVAADEEVADKKALRAMWQKGKLAAALEEEDEEIPEVVFEMAVKSISQEANPATETMAKIYLAQGKWEKAIDVYQQLQLRNPQKSAYFAEKIAAIEQQHRP